MPARKIAIDREALNQLYHTERKSLSEVAEIIGCSTQTVLNRMRQLGIERRPRGEACSLIPRTPEWKARIGRASRGRRASDATKRKISEAARGRPSPTKGLTKHENPDRVKGGCPGDAHWNWKGGISSENILIRQSSEYKAWRNAVFVRDDWTCVHCGKRGGEIQADHIKQFAHYPELRFDVENGRTLCAPCHKTVTAEQRKGSRVAF